MKDNGSTSTPSYVDLSRQTYTLFVDAMATANQRYLGYVKSLYEIMSRPYASNAAESTVREGFDRANQIVDLTVNELQASAQKNTELAEKFAAHGAKLQDSWTQGLRIALKTGISNMTYVKDAAETSFDGFAKRVEEMQSRAKAPSAN
jgi:hypothetical protein